jgi:hypothetical protein
VQLRRVANSRPAGQPSLRGLVGTSTSGAFVESATGIRAGARTGLSAVATAALFAASLPIDVSGGRSVAQDGVLAVPKTTTRITRW